MNNERVEKFLALVSEGTSEFEKKALWRQANKNWLSKSFAIALKIHSSIKSKGISQVKLAKDLGVTPQYIHKILQGKENLTLETICKIETALGISLIDVSFTQTEDYKFETSPMYIQQLVFNTFIPKQTIDIESVDYQPNVA
jgi:transcriptional regulator with XRE-family HTH domain